MLIEEDDVRLGLRSGRRGSVAVPHDAENVMAQTLKLRYEARGDEFLVLGNQNP